MERLKQRTAKPRLWLLLLRRAAPYAAATGAGFLLAGARFMDAPLPAAVCLMAAMGCTLPSLLCYLGAVAGSFLLWDTTGMLLTLACGFLTLVIHWAMEEMPAAVSPWFLPLSVLLPGMLAGGLLLVSEPLTMGNLFIFVVQMAYLPMGAMAAKRVLKEPEGMALCAALFSFISGCGRILLPGGVSIGAMMACAAVLWLGNGALVFPAAALMGLALDWSWQIPLSCGAALTAAAVGTTLFSEGKKLLRCGAFLVTRAGVIALSGGGGGLLFLAAAGGCIVFLLLPPCPAALGASREISRSLRLAAHAMERLYRQMEEIPPPNDDAVGTDVCRMTAERVCADCENKARCWEDGGETFGILLDAWPMLCLRGTAQEEDFPNRFRIRCHRLPRLLEALEESLHAKAERLQRSRHRRELRTAVGGQYRILGDFLRRCAETRPLPPPKRYDAEAAMRQKSRRGANATGDRALCWEQDSICRLLLCDGYSAQ